MINMKWLKKTRKVTEIVLLDVLTRGIHLFNFDNKFLICKNGLSGQEYKTHHEKFSSLSL